MKANMEAADTGGMEKGKRHINSYIRRHAEELSRGGLPVLLRKCQEFLIVATGMPAALLVRALRPFVLIRLGQLISERIGHFAANTEMYLCRRENGMDNPHAFDVFYTAPFVSNRQLKRMWQRTLHVWPIAGPVDKANRFLPGGQKHRIPLLFRGGDRDIKGLLPHTPVHLSFTPEEELQGSKRLRELGVPDGVPFICLQCRDSAYYYSIQPDMDWHYHDYLETNIENFIPAAAELANRGYFVLRTGAVVRKALQTTCHGIIDYATVGRSDFMDIFLGAKCYFYLGGPSGLAAVPMIFRRPLAVVNIVPLEYAYTWGPNDLFIPKKLWLRAEHRFLTFGEICGSEIGTFDRSELYEERGIEVIENTPEEITALALEMDERLKGTWQTTEEDEELQKRFRSFFRTSELNDVFLAHIGAEFLRQNQELLK